MSWSKSVCSFRKLNQRWAVSMSVCRWLSSHEVYSVLGRAMSAASPRACWLAYTTPVLMLSALQRYPELMVMGCPANARRGSRMVSHSYFTVGMYVTGMVLSMPWVSAIAERVNSLSVKCAVSFIMSVCLYTLLMVVACLVLILVMLVGSHYVMLIGSHSRHAEFSSASHREPCLVLVRGQILKQVQDDVSVSG